MTCFKVTKDQLADKLNQWAIQNKQDPKLWVKKSGNCTSSNSSEAVPKNGYVQTDLMFGDPRMDEVEFTRWRTGSEYKGADRHVMMASQPKPPWI